MTPSFSCPSCGLPTIEPVQIFEHDFLSVHSVKRGLVKSSATGKEIECMIMVKSCSISGQTHRTDFTEIVKAPIKKTVGKIENKPKGLFE